MAKKGKKSKNVEGDDPVQATMAAAKADANKAHLISTAKADVDTTRKSRNGAKLSRHAWGTDFLTLWKSPH